ncbi:MAG: hypothetical protein SNF68_06335 [Rikenellaceae bacterium]
MKREIIYSCAVAMFVANSAFAQVAKEVEVTQAYIPQIKEATKPTLQPDMEDDSHISPDIDYSITPTSIHIPLDNEPYSPVEMDYWEFKHLGNYYAKVALGVPYRSVVDIYASKSNESKGYFTAFLNQEGEYAKIKNDYGAKNNSMESHARVGTTAGLYLGRRTLEGALTYDNDYWSRYATSGTSDEHPMYQRAGVNILFGDNFSDLSRWNYALEAGAEQMWSNSDNSNTTVGADVSFGRYIFGGDLRLGASLDYIVGSDEYVNHTFGLSAEYRLESHLTNLLLGVDYYNDAVLWLDVDRGARNYFLPRIYVDRYISNRKFIAYFSLDGEIRHNNYASMTLRNPYVEEGLFGAKSTLIYDMDLGIKGRILNNRFSYNIYAEYEIAKDNLYWAYVEEQSTEEIINNSYIATIGNLNRLSLDVELLYRPTSKLQFEFTTSVSNYYDDKDVEWRVDVPTTKLFAGVEYRLGRVLFGANGEYISSRSTTQIYRDLVGVESLSTINIPATFNLCARAECVLNSGVVIFCNLTNILNNDLYEWARYREYGVGGVIGAKFEF